MKTFSKQILSFFLFLFFGVIYAGEVVFIPGWLTETAQDGSYEACLRKLYPGKKITVLTWQSNSVKMDRVIENADAFADSVTEYIGKKPEGERSELILIGHSMGGRIVAKTASSLAENGITVGRIVLLGAAVDFDIDLNDMIRCSREPVINVFSRNDSVLKYLYGNWKQKFAIGFSGAEKPPRDHFIEYRLVASAPEISNLRLTNATLESVVHLAQIYFNELDRINRGEAKPYSPQYDYSGVVVKKSFLSIPSEWTIPPVFKMDLRDSYADWLLAKTDVRWTTGRKTGKPKEHCITVYFIFDQYGRIASWSLWRAQLERRFNDIRDRIKPIFDPVPSGVSADNASAPE